jgi:CRISPR/Cas system-associated exonuclease Cas4 (RecB family)
MAWQRPQPKPGQPIERDKVYCWTTWLAKALGSSDACLRSVWFKSHFNYAKLPEKNAEQLIEWNREHNALMRERRRLLEENGYTCASEVDVKVDGKTAIIAGKEDLVATQPGRVLIVDGKTGKRRDSDFWQVLIYLWARLRKQKPADAPVEKLAGEVFYKTGPPVDVRVADVQRYEPELIEMVRLIAADEEPSANPSKHNCDFCNIRPEDCSYRWQAERVAESLTTEAF